MRKWGVLISVFYVLVLIFLFLPVFLTLAFGSLPSGTDIVESFLDPYNFFESGWYTLAIIGLLTAAQALLLMVSVDTSHKRLRPRRRVAVSVGTIAFAVGSLTAAALGSILVVFPGEDSKAFPSLLTWIEASPVAFWLIWGVVFYAYREQLSARLDRAVNWLIAGSVLELLIVVPCHIIVRQRGDCSAPGVTAYGIATGIAIMLMAFGPSVFFLYQKRIRAYENTRIAS